MKKIDKWIDLWTDAQSKKQPLTEKAKRRNELYKGVAQPIDTKTGMPAKR